MFVKGLLNAVLGLMKLSYCKKTLDIDGNACQVAYRVTSLIRNCPPPRTTVGP